MIIASTVTPLQNVFTNSNGSNNAKKNKNKQSNFKRQLLFTVDSSTVSAADAVTTNNTVKDITKNNVKVSSNDAMNCFFEKNNQVKTKVLPKIKSVSASNPQAT